MGSGPGLGDRLGGFAAMNDETGPTVHFVPDYTDENPYQDLLADALRRKGVTVRVTGSGGGMFPLLAGVLSPGRPDVVHVHFLHQFITPEDVRFKRAVALAMGLRTLAELLVLRFLGIELVWTSHDLLAHERRAVAVERWCKHLFIRWMVTDVIVHCESAKELVIECYRLPSHLRESMTVIPHGTFGVGYPNDISKATARDRLDLPEETFVFTFFGTVKRYKNIPALVEAFESLDGDARLVIAGNPATDTLEEELLAVSAAVDGVRTVFEFVPEEEIQLYMNAADTVVLPFRADRASVLTSGSVLLAMGFGRPVIAPDVGCIGEYVGDAGIVFDPEGENELRAAMERVIDTGTEQMGKRGHERVERLSWERVAIDTLSVYDDQDQGARDSSSPILLEKGPTEQ